MALFSYIKKFATAKQGNIAISFALALLPILLSTGAAIDYSRQSNLHSKVAHATDAALLAATSAAIENIDLENKDAVLNELNAVFEPYFLANLKSAPTYKYNGYSIAYNPTSKKVTVDVEIDYITMMVRIAGLKRWNADVRAASNLQLKAGGAFSMFLVLDRSGSMGWDSGQVSSSSSKSSGKGKKNKKNKKSKKSEPISKMDVLKAAVDQMVTELKASDTESNFIRMGAVGYSSHIWQVRPLNWNLDFTNQFVQSMWASGGTDSYAAMRQAYKRLSNPLELSQHQKKSGQLPELVLVFMTDGANNYASADNNTLKICDNAKAYGIKIYTVAFQAPAKGKALLSACASDSSHYFEPENTQDLIDAFSKIGANVAEKLVLSK